MKFLHKFLPRNGKSTSASQDADAIQISSASVTGFSLSATETKRKESQERTSVPMLCENSVQDYFSLYSCVQRRERDKQNLIDRLTTTESLYKPKVEDLLVRISELDNLIEQAQNALGDFDAEDSAEDAVLESEAETEPEPEKLSAKQLYRRLSALCHPDKTARLQVAKKTRERLTELFIAGKEAFRAKDDLSLSLLLDEAHTLLTSKHARKTAHDEIESFKRRIAMLEREITEMKSTFLYAIVEHHESGRYDNAESLMRAFFYFELSTRSDILRDLHTEINLRT